MAKAKVKVSFAVSKEQRDEALRVLGLYVSERSEFMQDKSKYDLLQAAQLMDALYHFKERLAELVKTPAEKAYDTLRFSIIPEFMDDQDIKTITYEGIGRVQVQDDIQVTTIDKAGLQEWLGKEDLEDLIVPTVNAQTLAAALRKRLKDGKAMPPEDTVKVTPIVRAQITRSA